MKGISDLLSWIHVVVHRNNMSILAKPGLLWAKFFRKLSPQSTILAGGNYKKYELAFARKLCLLCLKCMLNALFAESGCGKILPQCKALRGVVKYNASCYKEEELVLNNNARSGGTEFFRCPSGLIRDASRSKMVIVFKMMRSQFTHQ